jgi:long-chain acyl-CoA synthetase
MTRGAVSAARRSQDRAALDDGRLRIGYDELAELVAEERDWLAAHGQRFALLADNGVGWAIADLALHSAKQPCVPLPAFFSAGQLMHALDDAGIDCVLTDAPRRVHELLPGWQADGVSGRSGLASFRRELADRERPSLPPATGKITYTSGSTGQPKGVCLSAAQIETVASSLAGATESLGIERHLCLLPLATLLENIAGIHSPLLAGATCLLPPAETTGMSYGGVDPARMLGCIAQAQPESLVLVPELLRLLVTAAERGWRAPSSLRFVAVGGAPVSLELLSRAETAGLPVYEGYGLSECASVVCLNTPQARREGSVGQPLPHARVRIAADGQIMVSGVTMLGYLGDQPRQATEEWATGDLGEIDDDGFVYVRGRLRNMFISSLGRNVAPEWVEREIAQQPGVRHVMVYGEGRPYAVAIVCAMDPSVSDAELERGIAAANARLPDYARVRRWMRAPETFSFENGQLTSNGRLRRCEILRRNGTRLDELYDETTPA